MKLNRYFSLRRFWLLLRKDFYYQYKQGLISLGAIFGILVIVNISSILSSNAWNFNVVFYPLTLFIGGFIFTSLSFSELAREQTRIPFLILPASTLEKFISRLLISSAGYVVVSIILYYVFSGITFVFNSLVFGRSHPFFNLFDPVILTCIRIYLITQSVILLGALYFRGNALIKTILTLFIIATLYTLLAWLSAMLAYYLLGLQTRVVSPFGGFYGENGGFAGMPRDLVELAGIVAFIAQIFFWGFMAPFFWIIAYFRLKEMEV